MSFAACFLIPIYNHGRSIRVTVERLERYALPIFVVDDGSDDATRQVLATLAVDFPRLRLFRLPQNSYSFLLRPTSCALVIMVLPKRTFSESTA